MANLDKDYYLDKPGVQTLISELETNTLADEYSSSATYAVGDYCIHNNKIYRCTTAISTAESWTDAHWTFVVVGDELKSKKSGTVTSVTIKGTSPIISSSSSAITTSGTRTISHATSGATAGSYGDSSAQTPDYGGTFKVPYVTVDTYGHVTGISDHTVTIPASDNTDEQVKQILNSDNTNRPLLMSGASTSNTTTDVYGGSYRNNNIYANASTGTIRSKNLIVGFSSSNSVFPNGGILTHDVRNVTDPPTQLGVNFIGTNEGLPNNWYSGMYVKSGDGEYGAWELVGCALNTDNRTKPFYVRNSNKNTAWGDWRQLYDSANPPSATDVGLGNVANIDQSKAIKSITRSGTTFTYTCLDDSTGTFTQQDNDTKNTTGADNTTSKIFLVGPTAQTSSNGSARTYSNVNCYASGGKLYSNGSEVLTSHQSVTDGNPTLSWGTKSTVATIGSTEIHVTMPANPNTDRYHTTGSWSDLTYTATAVNSAGALAFTIPTGTTATTVALGNHTHTTSIATSTGTNKITLSAATKYAITAGGTSYVFTTPTDNDTKNTAGSTDTSSKIFLIGATSQAANPQTYSDDQVYTTSGTLQANIVSATAGVNANTGNSGTAGGVSLYSTSANAYGIAMRKTGTATGEMGKHGYVQGDWAIFNTMSAGSSGTRGWIFRSGSYNYASISAVGDAVFNGSVTVGGNATNDSGCRLTYNSTTQSCDFVFA